MRGTLCCFLASFVWAGPGSETKCFRAAEFVLRLFACVFDYVVKKLLLQLYNCSLVPSPYFLHRVHRGGAWERG